MRIVHVLPSLSKGGAERVAVDLANVAFSRGNGVLVLAMCKVDETLLRNDLLNGVDVRYVRPSVGWRTTQYVTASSWLLRHWRVLQAADVIHCHLSVGAFVGTLIFVVRRLARGSKPAVVETYHAVGAPIPRWQRSIHAVLAKQRDAFALMALDPFWERFAQRHSNARLIPNGVAQPGDTVSFTERTEFRRTLGIPDSCGMVVGTLGRLESARQPWLYPEVFAPIAKRFPDAHFIIAGAGPARDRVEETIAAAGLMGRVHLTGLIRNPQLAFSAIDLYVTLNVGPTTGVAAIEAASVGVPVLAIQTLKSYRPSHDNWIWSSADLSEIANVAIALLEQPAELSALAKRQQAYARDCFSIERAADAYEELYATAMARASAARA